MTCLKDEYKRYIFCSITHYLYISQVDVGNTMQLFCIASTNYFSRSIWLEIWVIYHELLYWLLMSITVCFFTGILSNSFTLWPNELLKESYRNSKDFNWIVLWYRREVSWWEICVINHELLYCHSQFSDNNLSFYRNSPYDLMNFSNVE